MTVISYETMWDVVSKLSAGYAQKWIARVCGVNRSYVQMISREYDVGRRGGQPRHAVKAENRSITDQVSRGLRPEVPIRTSIAGMRFPLRIRKDLLGPAEKAQIVASMRANPGTGIKGFSQEFKRLPATIVKIASEAGISLK